jgi:PKD repeat protein
LTCSFIDGSSDPDGSIVSRSWAFGDGATSTEANPSHTYPSDGKFTVTLTVIDDKGAQNSESRDVRPTAPPPPNQPPTAAFSSSCTALSCAFNSDGSSDPDGKIASRSWSFGDGSSSNEANPRHTYGSAGTYTVTLTVTDNDGAGGQESHEVTVAAPNQAPKAAFTGNCTDLSCSFSSQASSDLDGNIVSWSWTFGDGSGSSDANPSHSYSAGGKYTVTLTVTDDNGASDAATQEFTVKEPPAPNQPPTASFSSDCHDLTCSFNSDGSSDADGTIVSRSWDFGDGTTSSEANPSHTYADGGTFTVVLTVTDDKGASASQSQGVTVAAPAPPS